MMSERGADATTPNKAPVDVTRREVPTAGARVPELDGLESLGEQINSTGISQQYSDHMSKAYGGQVLGLQFVCHMR